MDLCALSLNPRCSYVQYCTAFEKIVTANGPLCMCTYLRTRVCVWVCICAQSGVAWAQKHRWLGISPNLLQVWKLIRKTKVKVPRARVSQAPDLKFLVIIFEINLKIALNLTELKWLFFFFWVTQLDSTLSTHGVKDSRAGRDSLFSTEDYTEGNVLLVRRNWETRFMLHSDRNCPGTPALHGSKTGTVPVTTQKHTHTR